jgi:TonB family protein
MTLWFALEPVSGTDATEWRELVRYAIPIAERYRQSPTISFRTWPGTIGDQEEVSTKDYYRGLDPTGFMRFTIGRNGHLVGEPRSYSDSPEVARDIRQAVLQADSAGDFPVPAGPEQGQNRTISFAIGMRTTQKEGTVAFARVRLPVIELESPPEMLRPGPQRYPDEEKSRGREGRVDVYYVIDETGHALEQTIVALRSTSEAFAQSVIAMIRRSLFRPASVGGCPMSTGVYQTINFNIW